MKAIKFTLGALLLLAALNILFLLSLMAVQNLDQVKIKRAIEVALVKGEFGDNNWPPGPFGRQLDMYSECIALSSAVLPPNSKSLLERAVEHDYLYTAADAKSGTCGSLGAYLRGGGENLPKSIHYIRYWHGYDVYLRPFLRMGKTLGEIHNFTLILTMFLVATLAYFWSRLVPITVPTIVFGTLVLATDIVQLPVVVTHALGILVALVTASAMAGYLLCKRSSLDGLGWIAVISGACFAFFDFLINPPFTPTLLAYLIISVSFWRSQCFQWKWTKTLFDAGLVAGIWFVSYATSWAAKWLIAAVVLGPDAVADEVFAQVRHRLGGDTSAELGESIPLVFGLSSAKNLQTLGWPVVALYISVSLLIVAVSMKRFGQASRSFKAFLALSCPALIPLAWMEVLKNHSLVHHWFVFRSLGLSLGIIAASAMLVYARSSASSKLPAQ